MNSHCIERTFYSNSSLFLLVSFLSVKNRGCKRKKNPLFHLGHSLFSRKVLGEMNGWVLMYLWMSRSGGHSCLHAPTNTRERWAQKLSGQSSMMDRSSFLCQKTSLFRIHWRVLTPQHPPDQRESSSRGTIKSSSTNNPGLWWRRVEAEMKTLQSLLLVQWCCQSVLLRLSDLFPSHWSL